MTTSVRVAWLLGGGVFAGALWWRTHPSACPYGQRWLLELPHPFVTRTRLQKIIGPVAGERVLEVGPGAGYYTVAVAKWVGDGGCLDVLDVQQEMLDLAARRVREQGLDNVVATRGDAQSLPYPDRTFDAAFLVTVLGEVPDQAAAVRELARVLRPGGRLVVGELFGDPHWVRPGRLLAYARTAGLRPDSTAGTPLAYFARFSRPA